MTTKTPTVPPASWDRPSRRSAAPGRLLGLRAEQGGAALARPAHQVQDSLERHAYMVTLPPQPLA